MAGGTPTVALTEDAAAVLHDSDSATFLESRPAEHNLILSLLHQRAASGEPGRYWTVSDGNGPVGVVLQSPPTFRATMTPMAAAAAATAAESIAAGGYSLPGVDAEATTAAAFAGRWTEVCRVGARPVHGMRLQVLDLDRLTIPGEVPGALRPAVSGDLALVHEWMIAFAAFVGDPPPPDVAVAYRVERDQFVLWEVDGTVVCAAARTPAFARTCRIGPVYTPPEYRRHGYAAACVGHLSQRIMEEGFRCVLYTDLANPTSNSVYRSLGYRTIVENVRYEFDGECQT